MDVDDKGQFRFVGSQVGLVGLSLRLTEGRWTREVGGTWVVLSILVSFRLQPRVLSVVGDVVNLAEVNSKVSVQIDTLLHFAQDTGCVLRVPILPHRK